MAQIQQRLLAVPLLVALAAPCAERKFFPDDPVWKEPAPLPIAHIAPRNLNAIHDFLHQCGRPERRLPSPAGAINTLGEVPDSAWFTNRHGRRRMTPEELKRGQGADRIPVPPYTVIAARTNAITEDFRFLDSKGRLYFVRPDPFSNPELTTGADIIGSRFFHVLGYNTRERYLIYPRRSDLRIQPGALITGLANRRHRMEESHLDRLLRLIAKRKDGTWRLLAAYLETGEAEGPFRFEGTRTDDPNDLVPHENRRDLRGLHVICAWLNHTQISALNTRDLTATENGVRFLKHYLVNFTSVLGSDADRVKDARLGYDYVLPTRKSAFGRMASFGLHFAPWELADFPGDRALGRIEAQVFDPETWKPAYPNPAFLSRDPVDEYWGAKLVMSLSRADIRTIVDTAEFSRKETAELLTSTLADRRDKIGRTYFRKVLALDNFRLEGGEIRFDDLAVVHRFAEPRQYSYAWHTFDNLTGGSTAIQGATSAQWPRLQPGAYAMVRIAAIGDESKYVTVYLSGAKVIGLDRAW